MQTPSFSIITPAFNCADKIKGTIDSVLAQNESLLEYWIIDGGSTDGTVACLRTYNSRIHWLSEPDRGVYDAMNKGVSRAGGRYILFLGAGDLLLPHALEEISLHLPSNDSYFLYCNAMMGSRVYDGPFTREKLCVRNICHQAILYGREVFRDVGQFNLKYPFLADWEFNMRCFSAKSIRKLYAPLTISVFELGGISALRDQAFEDDKRELIGRYLGWRALLFWFLWKNYKSPLGDKVRCALKTLFQHLRGARDFWTMK
jgi:glycosyltransferase involved in cell wall biosynthesis